MDKIELSSLPKIQSSTKNIVKFRGAANSADYNDLQEELFFDISNMFNLLSEYENALQETSTAQCVDNVYTQMRCTTLQNEIEYLRNKVARYETNEPKQILISQFNSEQLNNENVPILSRQFNQINIMNHSVNSKLYLYDEGVEVTTIPSSLAYDITPVADGVIIQDTEFTNAFNGNSNEFFVRKVISDNTDPKEMEIVITLPDNIISSRDVNAIELMPFPYSSLDITKLQYQLNGNWNNIPGLESHKNYEPQFTVDTFGDAVDIGYIRQAEDIKLCFSKTPMSKIRIKLRQDTYIQENGKYVFYMGIKKLDVNCENVGPNCCEFFTEFNFQEDGPKLITSIIPYFNNDSILSDQSIEKKSLLSYELYSIEEDGTKEYIKNSFPIVADKKNYALHTKMYYDRVSDINPSLYKLTLMYEPSNRIIDDACTCSVDSFEINVAAVDIKYDKDYANTVIVGKVRFAGSCPVHSTSDPNITFRYYIKEYGAEATLTKDLLTVREAGLIEITAEVHYSGRVISKDFKIDVAKEPSPVFAIEYLSTSGGMVNGKINQKVSYQGSGEQVEAVADPSNVFVKWSDGELSKIRKETDVKNNISVTAMFERASYTVKFLDSDGSELKVEKVLHGQAAAPPIIQEKLDLEFTGWDMAFDNVTSNITVRAQYVTSYTVTFTDWNGIVLSRQRVKSGGNAIAPVDPVRSGYTFDKWIGEYKNITSSRTVVASYQIVSHEIIFLNYDGSTIKKQNVTHGQLPSAPAVPERLGYTFVGWDKTISQAISPTSYTAQFQINTYSVTFMDWDDSIIKVQRVQFGGTAVAPSDPIRVGYTFTGWDKPVTNISADTVINATYSTATYTVTWKADDGSTIKTEVVAHGVTVTPPTPSVIAGKTFDRWEEQ